MNKFIYNLLILIGFVFIPMTFASAQGADCASATPLCGGSQFPAVTGGGNTTTSANSNCLGFTLNESWFWVLIDASGSISSNVSISPTSDIDFAAWGPFTDPTAGCGMLSIINEVSCDYTTTNGGTLSIANATAGEYYLLVVSNFGDDAGTISMDNNTGAGALACPECAATCADASTTSCSNYVTGLNMQVTSYGEIQANGGEACFTAPIDVSAADMSVTQCFEYVHTVPNDAFFVLSGNSVIENNDVNGVTECFIEISSIEIFDASCVSLASGGQGISYNSAVMGTTYTICVTSTAGNGTAEGDCSFQCMAHSITPTGNIPPQCNAVYDYSVMPACSGGTLTFTEDSGACVEPDDAPGSTTPHLDLDWYLYAPGGTAGMAPAGYDPTPAIDNTYPTTNTDLSNTGVGLGGTWNGLVCANLDVTAPVNNTCAPITVTYYALPWDRLYDTDGDGNGGEYGSTTCDELRFDVVIYPAAMSAVVTDDGSTCGTPMVTLVAGDGSTVCETETGAACVTTGDSFTTNFAATTTGTAVASHPAACNTVPEATVTCADCVVPCAADNGTW